MPVRASDFSISSMNLKSISKVLESSTGGKEEKKKRFRYRQRGKKKKKKKINNHCLIESSPSLKFTFLVKKRNGVERKCTHPR